MTRGPWPGYTDGRWPYPDLELRTPACPLCGAPATLMVAPYLHPSAWCRVEECRAVTWDPTKSAAELLAAPYDMDAGPDDTA